MIMPTVIKALHSFRHFGVFFLVWDVFVCVGWAGKVNSFDCSVLGYVFFSFIVYYHLAVPKSSTNLSIYILTFFEIHVWARLTHLTVLKQT